MVKYYGYVYLDPEYTKWWITKWEVKHQVTLGSESDYITIHLRNLITKKNRQITIYSGSVLWGVVEDLQRRYPGAIYWKTEKQRWKMR